MKSLMFLCCLTVALSIELRFTSHPVGIIFKEAHKIAKIERFEKINIDLNIDNLKSHTKLIKENVDKMIELCKNQKIKINCDLLEIFLNNRITDVEAKSLFRVKRGFFCQVLNGISYVFYPAHFGYEMCKSTTLEDQKTIDILQKDIKINRELIKNETMLLNKTINTQQELNDLIFAKIKEIKNFTGESDRSLKFFGALQSILMLINDDAEISNAIIGLMRSPHYTHVLQLLGFKTINKRLCQIQKTLKPRESLASEKSRDVRKALAVSNIKIQRTKSGLTIEIKVPIIVGWWQVFEMLPTFFKGESGAMSVDTQNRYYIRGNNNSYALFTQQRWDMCKKIHRHAVCKFDFTNQPSCENELYVKQEIKDCKLKARKVPKVIRVNVTHAYANVVGNTLMKWQCGKAEHAVKMDKSAWIILERNCKMSLLSGKGMKRVYWPRTKFNISTIPFNASNWILQEPSNDQAMEMNKVASLRDLLPDIRKIFEIASKPIEKIVAQNSFNEIATRVSLITMAIFVILACIKCYLCKN